MSDILHILNLDTIGGVEELFVHFLTHSPSQYRHHLFITGAALHPRFQDIVMRHAHSITYEKYLFGAKIKIPKMVRRLKRIRAFSKKNSHIVLWNRFETIQSQAKVIYYEHGASWIEPKGSISEEYFDHIDTILVNSEAAKQILQLKWGIKKPIFTIENPLRPDLNFTPKPRSLPQDTFVIGYIGRLIPLKGVALLLHALQQLQERAIQRGVQLQLKIAGVGSEQEALEKEAVRLGITNSVQFLGAITAITEFYDGIDLLVVPSIREPLGLVALEAAARGCPVIATLVDGLPEVVLDGKTGFCIRPTLPIEQYVNFGGNITKLPDVVFDPENKKLKNPRLIDPKILADRIDYVMRHPKEYTKLSENALSFTQKRSNFTAYTQKLLSFISDHSI